MIFDRVLDIFRGKAVTIPPMDGALRPNTALDEATILQSVAAPDNLIRHGAQVLFSSGAGLCDLARPGEPIARLPAPISALAAAPDGTIAIGLETGEIVLRGGPNDGRRLTNGQGMKCPVALAFAADGTLFVCHGSATHAPADWAPDLMGKGATGSVWQIDTATGAEICRARGLAFPSGLLLREKGASLIVSESWRHRLVEIGAAGAAPRPVLTALPGYPSRLTPTRDGGALLAVFAPRSRLVEFVLLEDDYRADMMRDIAREHWIAPSLSSGASFLEPLQCGSVKTMGVHKPWSPTRSYGLLVRLDAALRPLESFHSRANGHHHGITSALEVEGGLIASARGGNALLRVAGA